MQKNYFTSPLRNPANNADFSVSVHDLINPEVEINTSEGDEFLDDIIRTTEQPYSGAQTPEEG